MSHVCLQFGQCGNQLGYEFFSVINEDINSSDSGICMSNNRKYCDVSTHKWFDQDESEKLFARAVLIDTERKVTKSIISQAKSNQWGYKEDNCILESSSGAANNWALGYMVKGPEIYEETMNKIRKECEQCDRLESIISFGSSAGGTGSGVGSYITEEMRDCFSSKTLLNVLVLPYKTGEVVTQNFNTLLTIAKFYDNSNAIFLFENDEIHKITTGQLNIKDVTFHDLNKVISEQIASVFQPVEKTRNITDGILGISAHSQYKLLSIKTSPFIAESTSLFEPLPSWEHLKKTIIKTLKEPFNISLMRNKKNVNSNFSKSVGNVVFLRGLNADNEPETLNDTMLNLNMFYTNWVPKQTRCVTFRENRKFLNKARFATLVTNNSLFWPVFDNIIGKSWDTFVHNAYVHQYVKYGVTNDDFLDAFLKAEKIVKSYKDL